METTYWVYLSHHSSEKIPLNSTAETLSECVAQCVCSDMFLGKDSITPYSYKSPAASCFVFFHKICFLRVVNLHSLLELNSDGTEFQNYLVFFLSFGASFKVFYAK